MFRTPVISSNLASIGYDPASHVLEVEFKNGSVYQYLQVPQFDFRNLMAASSKGSYFDQNIRNSYQYQRVG